MSRRLFWLNDEQWVRIKPHLPTDVRGKPRVGDRRVIGGIVHVLRSGCRWCDCPEAYGPPITISITASRAGPVAVCGKTCSDTQMIDSTHVKAHRSAAGGKGGSKSRR